MKFCFIADAAHIDKCKALNYNYIDADQLKNKVNPSDKKAKDLKRWARKFKLLFISDSLLKQLPKLGGPMFAKWGLFPTVINSSDNIQAKVEEGLATIKYQLKKGISCKRVSIKD